MRLWIAFHNPTETLSDQVCEAALATGDVATPVCARIGMGDDPPRDEIDGLTDRPS